MYAELKFYATLLLRRLPLVVVVTGLFSVMGVMAAVTSKDVYSAAAVLAQESPQISDSLVRTTIETNASAQLELIEQRLLTRANLLDIAARHNVFENRAEMTPDDTVAAMRAATTFQRSSGRDRATVINVAFEARHPEIAAAVVGDYVTRILDENVRERTARAGDTLAFFEQEVERLSLELDQRSAAILNFQNANIDALPDTLDYRLGQQASLQERIGQLNREIASLEDQRARLTQLFEATGRLAGAAAQISPEEAALRAARIELEQARRVYSESNPRVQALIQRVSVLEAARDGQPEASGSDTPDEAATSPDMAMFGLQLAEIDSRVSFSREEIARLQASLATLNETIDKTPANSVQLQALEREYSNTQNLYNAAAANLAAARTGERIEVLSKGERITVLSEATPPNNPIRPDRKKIAAFGVAAGIGASIGLVVLLELLNRAIRRPKELTARLGIVPLVTIPYLPNRRETNLRRLKIAAVFMLVFAVLPGGLFVIHDRFMPLDDVVQRVVGRLGL
jgi:uncharacterized protein involved in exopolysaccharide biosynthesis